MYTYIQKIVWNFDDDGGSEIIGMGQVLQINLSKLSICNAL